MTLRTFNRLERPWLLATLGLGSTAFIVPQALEGPSDGAGGIASQLWLMAGILTPLMMLGAFFVVRRFARVWVAGMLAGTVIGIVVLGTTLRIAMRIAAILDPIRRTEFTGETLFVLFVGGFLGAWLGVMASIAERLWRPRVVPVGVVVGVLGITQFLSSEGTRDEIFGLGAGPLVNIPMFFLCFALFGWAVAPVITWLHRRLPRTPGRQLEEIDETAGAAAVTRVG